MNENKETYNKLDGLCGVYIIDNAPLGKVLIGKSQDVGEITKAHKELLRMGKHPNTEMQKDFTATNGEGFSVNRLEAVPVGDKKLLSSVCWNHVKKYEAMKPRCGYNMTVDGSRGVMRVAKRERRRVIDSMTPEEVREAKEQASVMNSARMQGNKNATGKRSPEACQKMREKRLLYWQNKRDEKAKTTEKP